MEAPKCKLCGERHYGMCAFTITGKGRAAISLPTDSGGKRFDIKNNSEGDVAVFGAGSTATIVKPGETLKIRFDRTAYQRDYMRKRRAKEKK